MTDAMSGYSNAGHAAMEQLMEHRDGTMERNSHPDTGVTLFLRIETVAGPRTIVASGLPLSAASAIAEALTEAGHYAEYVEQRPQIAVREWVALRQQELAPPQATPLAALSA
jgi:hypothetical protein